MEMSHQPRVPALWKKAFDASWIADWESTEAGVNNVKGKVCCLCLELYPNRPVRSPFLCLLNYFCVREQYYQANMCNNFYASNCYRYCVWKQFYPASSMCSICYRSGTVSGTVWKQFCQLLCSLAVITLHIHDLYWYTWQFCCIFNTSASFWHSRFTFFQWIHVKGRAAKCGITLLQLTPLLRNVSQNCVTTHVHEFNLLTAFWGDFLKNSRATRIQETNNNFEYWKCHRQHHIGKSYRWRKGLMHVFRTMEDTYSVFYVGTGLCLCPIGCEIWCFIFGQICIRCIVSWCRGEVQSRVYGGVTTKIV
jgi:hypothetical protein